MCFKSRPICLIVLWSFLTHLGLYFCISSGNYLISILFTFEISSQPVVIAQMLLISLFYFLYPLGGLMGDVLCGRYKVIERSLLLLTFTAIMLLIAGCLYFLLAQHPSITKHDGAIALAVFGCLVFICVIGLVGFFANIIPFAMDQLRDSPSQSMSGFIYWYFWTLFVSSFLDIFISSVQDMPYLLLYINVSYEALTITESTCFIAMSSFVLIVSGISYFIMRHKSEWFNIDPCNVNPYKLVYKVTKFALQHKIPIRRSAFTYCEDDPPSRLDLGKTKFGGPFQTEEVEDVKVFYEILKILVSLGPFFYVVGTATYTFEFSDHLSDNFSGKYMLQSSMLKYLLASMLIPFYLYFRQYRLFQCFFVLRSLRKIEIGLIIVLIELLLILVVDIVAHVKDQDLECMFKNGSGDFSHLQVACILVVLQILSALHEIILYTSFIEFICAQSPHFMKGMLIGLAYALLRGFFPLLGMVLEIPFESWKFSGYISCGFVFYSVNIIIGLVSFVLFVCVAKRYTYRERDEPCRVRQYAEAYYSNPHQEPHYDYDVSSL